MHSVSKLLVVAVISLIAPMPMARSAAAQAQTQAARIPATHGTTFSGIAVTLPDDLHGRVGVLVLGFSKGSGDVCKAWGQRLAQSYGASREVMYYQMPV